jgi:hypothetical protein
MSLLHKKRIDEEEIDPDYDGEDGSESFPEPKPKEQPKQTKQITKEEVMGLIQYHQLRTMELLELYRRLE